MAKPPSRPKRWAAACAAARKAIDAIEAAKSDFESAMSDLKEIQDEYEEWKDSLPDNLQQSPVGEKLETVCSIDIEGAAESITTDDASSAVDEAEGADLPIGFGKD